MGTPRAVRILTERVRGTIERRGLFKGGETVVVAVSGGPDSLALLHVLDRLVPDFRLILHVAHFDHRLRNDSHRDALFVERTARRLGLPSTVRAAAATDTPPGLSPEEVARERRYGFLEEMAGTVGATAIATGHTLDDQAETVLMRVLSGTGVRGLGGIPPVRGSIVRPLIDARRSETEDFCRSLRLRPRRDPTNADPAFLRNALRNELVPLILDRFNFRAPEALARLADLARDDDALLDELAATALELTIDEDGVRIDVQGLLALHPALQRRVVRRIAPLAADHVERVLRLARHGTSGDRIDLPARLNVALEYGSLAFGRAASPPVPASPVALAVPGLTDLPAWSMRMRTWIETRAPSAWPDGRNACVLDFASTHPPALVVRRPRTGDRFRPLGMSRGKKLGDFFTDAKVPRPERERAALVTSGGEIVWVVGHRPDDRFKVTGRTTRFLWLEAGPIEGGAQ